MNLHTRHSPRIPLILAALAIVPAMACAQTAGDEPIIDEGFEQALPDFHTYQATYEGDETQAHSGKRSLRVDPQKGSGGAYFRLKGLIDPKRDYVFSAWVMASDGSGVSLYVSAAGEGGRHIKGQASGGGANKWVKLEGTVRNDDWKTTDSDIMLAMTAHAPAWFDDVTLRPTVLPDPPIEVYPELLNLLRTRADARARTISPGQTVRLTPEHSAYAPDSAVLEVREPDPGPCEIDPDGLLTFAVDAPEPVFIKGELALHPSEELQPGLRAYVLCDDTVIAAPMVTGPPWQGVGNAFTGPAPDMTGETPPVQVALSEFLLPRGRHYITVAGPHFRPGGELESIELNAATGAATDPLYQFAVISDTHLSSGRAAWMNVKMDGPAREELLATLKSLKAQGVSFAVLAGDMTDNSKREQFSALGEVCRQSGLTVYGCVGNHDAYTSAARPDALSLCAPLFPEGTTNYTFSAPPIRFIVLDGSYWRTRDGKLVDHYDRDDARGTGMRPEDIEWLRTTLQADTRTPTIAISHYPTHGRKIPSSCGYKLPGWGTGGQVGELLDGAPNLVATICGHTHWNEVNEEAGAMHVVNPAFTEWPNAFRVFRVFPDRVEWEVRQVQNRGFIRESFVVQKRLSWMISTGPGDLTGDFILRPQDAP